MIVAWGRNIPQAWPQATNLFRLSPL